MLLAFCNKVRNSALLFLISTFFGMLPVLLCQIGPLSMDQLLFQHHKSMTHDTYDTCFYKLITRAQERRKKIYILYI